MTKTKKRPPAGEITISEAVSLIHWHPDKILAACERGEIPAVLRGDEWLISRKRLQQWNHCEAV